MKQSKTCFASDLVTGLRIRSDHSRAVREAIRYKELREKLKHKEISLYVYQIEQIHTSWSEANASEQLKEERLALSTVVSAHDAKLESDRSAARQLEQEVEDLQSQLLQFSELFEKSEGYGEVLKERRRNLERTREQLEESLQSGDERLGARVGELASMKAAQELQQELTSSGPAVSGRSEAGGRNRRNQPAQEESLKGNLLELMNQMAQARNEIRYADQRREALDRRMNRAQEESGKWEALKEDLLRRKDSIDRSIERFGKEIAELRAVISASERYQSLQKLREETQEPFGNGSRSGRRKSPAAIP